MSGINELANLAGKGLDALERAEQREKDERAELDKAADAVRKPLPEPADLKTCNRHSDCDAADAAWLAAHPHDLPPIANLHCHDDCCEDCFGS